ncbi:MAG: UvrD-helicase domain-containing protein, partial [Lachnospiraceae bacterium]|nr:UvrD-helicase domain-containing protein [Lachnospiraceae bacterium]
MAGFEPNEAQQKAIDTRGKNVLVSAAAGSGKTTVLVERVLKMVMEEKVDIDSLIIMTFTKAAAASMKEKIYSRIRSALKKEELEEDVKEHLKRQLMKIHGARICTIDSLCMDIVKENFQCVDIDPGFSIADEAEIAMMKSDILGEILEDHYGDPTENFLNFASNYTDKDDSKIEELILELLRFAESHPSPDTWLHMLVASYEDAATLQPDLEKEANRWLLFLAQIINSKIESIMDLCLDGIIACGEHCGPENYLGNFEYVQTALEAIQGNCFDNRGTIIKETLAGWPSLKPIRSKDVEETLKEQAKEAYGAIKEELKKLYDRFFYQDLESMYKDMGNCGTIVRELVGLTCELREKLMEAKKERNIYGFNDIAHFALDVLIGYDEEGKPYYTETADSLAKATVQIIVDEYQDTNRLQDALVAALSAERFGRPDVFMVGDMKQSIYGFRLACPELFIEKYNSYDAYENCERIILGENYRSRKEVVDFTNLIFSQTMTPSVGGIDYNDGNALIYGAKFEEPLFDMTPEILMINGSGENAKISESYEIAKKIEELVGSGSVRYSDIAILTRTANNPKLERCLSDRNIPMVKSANKGFFDTMEIRLALNLLRIIDNPMQDIPFAAVLTSPVVGLDANRLAKIKTNYDGSSFRM